MHVCAHVALLHMPHDAMFTNMLHVSCKNVGPEWLQLNSSDRNSMECETDWLGRALIAIFRTGVFHKHAHARACHHTSQWCVAFHATWGYTQMHRWSRVCMSIARIWDNLLVGCKSELQNACKQFNLQVGRVQVRYVTCDAVQLYIFTPCYLIPICNWQWYDLWIVPRN